MIDIHSHVLPMVDDGATSIEMALEMLDVACKEGTKAMILTPHFAKVYGFDNPSDKIRQYFLEFCDIVRHEHIPIQLYLGCEYLYTTKENFLMDYPDLTKLNDTQYLLFEYFFDENEATIVKSCEVILEAGLIPIMAHPERFEVFQLMPELAQHLHSKGVLFQLNKGSVLGRYGKKVQETAHYFLKHHYYHFVGSDAHHSSLRTTRMQEAYECIAYYYGHSYAKELFITNPQKLTDLPRHRI